MFKEISAREYKGNVTKQLSESWALLTSGNLDDYNTMTVSWGAAGELWNEDCIFCFVRPQRYTYSFMEKNDYFTLSFFGEEEHKALVFCGGKAGRDYDKAKETGLIPFDCKNSVSFESAEAIFVCKKIAYSDIDPDGFIDKAINKNYQNNDYHRMYIGKIEQILVKE